MSVRHTRRHRWITSTRGRIALIVLLIVPLVGIFLLNPALGAALSAAGTVVALVLTLGERAR
ncbi:MAG TPA: hypothetical protein VFB94_09335 [Acidimicrobiales bacterium]|nr:hypothetical protein [Acidimicrobiales bacterium]